MTLRFGLPFRACVVVYFFWGIGHSVFFNTSRTLFQQAAPPTHRARVLSVHSVGFFGMSPISNVVAGLMASAIGALNTCALAGGIMIVVVGATWVLTDVRRLE